MLTIYCPNCGGKAQYSIKKPSFCGECGVPYEASIANTPIVHRPDAQIRKKPIIGIEIQTEEEAEASLPNIEKIQVDFVPDRPVRVRFGEVWGANEGQKPDQRRKIPKRINKKALLEELKIESQSAARPIAIGD